MTESKKTISLSLISFAYNEEEILEKTICAWVYELRSLGYDFEIILVNDGSIDRTGEIANALAGKFKELRVFHLERNLGIGHALLEARKYVTKEIVFWNDIDGHFNLWDMKKVIPFLEDPQIDVVALFKHDNWSTKRSLDWLKSRLNFRLIQILFHPSIRDFQFVQFYPRVLFCEGISIRSCSSFIPAECIIKSLALGLTIRQIQIYYHSGNYRTRRSSKGSGFKAIEKSIKDIISFWFKWTFAGEKQAAKEQWKKTFGDSIPWRQ